MLHFGCTRTFTGAIPLQGRASSLGVQTLHHKPCVTSPTRTDTKKWSEVPGCVKEPCSWADLPLFRCQGAGPCQSVSPGARSKDNGKCPFLILQNCISPSAGYSYLPDAREVIFQCSHLSSFPQINLPASGQMYNPIPRMRLLFHTV